MRKKWLALMLCICLLAGSLPAMADIAVKESTQLDKLKGHWMNSSFQGTLTATATQTGPAFIPADLWSVIRAYLSSYSISFTHTNQDSTSALGSEDVLTLTNEAGDVSIQNIFVEDHNGIRYVRSPLLDDQIYYAFDDHNDSVSLLTDALGDDTWPSLWHVLFAVMTASEDWKTRAQSSYNQLSIKITTWLQNYAKTTTEPDTAGNYVVSNDYEIPASALLQEAKMLLVDLFVDQELLSLLREIMTVDEQAAYLQKDMLWNFMSMIDRVQLSGNIQIHRQFGASGGTTGDILYESMTIPFAEKFPVKEATVVHTVQPDGDLWQIKADLAHPSVKGAVLEASAQKIEEGTWVGDIKWTPAPDENSVVEPQTLTFAYNLEWPGAEDVNDSYSQRYEHNRKGTLVIKADDSLGLPVISISFNSKIYSKTSSLTAPTYLEAALSVLDLESNAEISFALNGRTSSRRTPIYMDEAIASSLRLDMLNTQSRMSLLQSLLHNLPARFLQLVNAQ